MAEGTIVEIDRQTKYRAGIILTELPQTIQDAVWLTRKLVSRYL
jgi:hypothetical protein